MNDRRSVAGNRGREQNPAYGLLRPLYFGSTADVVVLPSFSRQALFMAQQGERTESWQQLVHQVRDEYLQLDEQEKIWISARCSKISLLQNQLDQLFQKGDGFEQCRSCCGDCCALGHNHLTLANLLLWLSQKSSIPELDFSATCPLLSPAGCILHAGQRPYNCISFLCDRIEGKLQPQDVQSFYLLERELRSIYYAFSERYAGGSMTGLLLSAQRLQGQVFLRRIDGA